MDAEGVGLPLHMVELLAFGNVLTMSLALQVVTWF